MLNKIFRLVIVVAMLLPLRWRGGAEAGSLVFICHKGMNYSHAEVMMSLKGQLDEPRPVDNKPLFHDMLKQIGYDAQKYERTWNKQVFRRALFYPKMLDDDEAVIQWVASSYAGLGYVHAAPRRDAGVEVCGL